MEQDTTDKLRLENEIIALKREYKKALENLERVKEDTSDILKAKDRTVKDLDEKSEELLKVLNDISSEKLSWVSEKNTKMDELKQKESDAQKILDRASELDLKESKLNIIKEETTKIRNGARQLVFKNERDNVALNVRERGINDKETALIEKEKQFNQDKQDFKEKVKELFNNLETI
jgi:chromosome segregation ATPase